MNKKLFTLFSSLILVSASYVGAMSPEDALQALIAGNQRYVADQLQNADNNMMRRACLFSKQQPFAIVLGCSDSRVAPEIVFDQTIGDLFVVRVAGNVLGAIELDSIEYSALYLGSRLLLVLGHENCGAVKAVLEGKTQDIEAIAAKIEPAIQKIIPTEKDAVEKAVLANIQQVVTELSKAPALAKLLKSGQLKIAGGYYDLLSGRVRILDAPQNK